MAGKDKADFKNTFEPVIESLALSTNKKVTTIRFVKIKTRTPPYSIDAVEITQNAGKIVVLRSKLKEFGQEIIDIAETYSGTWNAEIFK